MNISAWSIRHPVPALLLFGLLTLLGLRAFGRLGIQNFPDIDFPMVTVQASLEGAAPSQMEAEVARKIEARLSSLNQLNHVETTISDGSVTIFVMFKVGKDLEEALGEVRNAVDSTRAELPETVSETMRRLSTAKPAASISRSWFSVVWPEVDTRR